MEQRIVIRLASTRPPREGGGKTARTLPGIPAEALIRHAEAPLLQALAQHYPGAEVQLLPARVPATVLPGIWHLMLNAYSRSLFASACRKTGWGGRLRQLRSPLFRVP